MFNKLRQLVRSKAPELVFLSETKFWGQKAVNLKRRLGYENGIHVDSAGKSGGLILLWGKEWVVDVNSFSSFHIDAIIIMAYGKVQQFTGVYGEPIGFN